MCYYLLRILDRKNPYNIKFVVFLKKPANKLAKEYLKQLFLNRQISPHEINNLSLLIYMY